MYVLQFQFRYRKNPAGKFLEKRVMMSHARNAKRFQTKFAKMFELRSQKELAPKYLLNNAKRNQGTFVAMFQGTNATQFPNKSQFRNASRFQDKFVLTYQKRNAVLFHSRNAKTGKSKIANSNALTIIGARNARLVNDSQE